MQLPTACWSLLFPHKLFTLNRTMINPNEPRVHDFARTFSSTPFTSPEYLIRSLEQLLCESLLQLFVVTNFWDLSSFILNRHTNQIYCDSKFDVVIMFSSLKYFLNNYYWQCGFWAFNSTSIFQMDTKIKRRCIWNCLIHQKKTVEKPLNLQLR